MRKKQGKSDPLSSAPNINNVILRRRFENLKRTDEPFNADSHDDDDDGSGNNGLGPPPSPPNLDFLRPTAPPLTPPILSPQRLIPTAPPLENVAPPPPFSLFIKKDASTGTLATPGEQIISEIERVIEKEKEESAEVDPDDPLSEYFKGINDDLDENYRRQKENDQLELERFNREHGLDKLVDELDAGIDSGDVPESLEFYFGGQNENFFSAATILAPNPANANFIDCLASDFGSRLMRENRLSIYIEAGDLYHKDLNTGESIYRFILSQRDELKKIINAQLYCGGLFENYLLEFLTGIDSETDARLDTLSNKNLKYLLYRYNDFLISRGLSTADIRHTKLTANKTIMEKLQNRDWQLLIESLIYKVEKDNDYYKITTSQDSKMKKDMEKTIGFKKGTS